MLRAWKNARLRDITDADTAAWISSLVSAEDFVFAPPNGGVLHLRNFRRMAGNPAVRAMGLGGLTPHALPHTAAILAIVAVANVKVVQQLPAIIGDHDA